MDPNQSNQNNSSAGGSRQAIFTPQPIQPEASANTNTPAQPSTVLSHPYFSNHPTQTFNNEAGDIILNAGSQKPKHNKRPFIIGGIILAAFAVICVVVLVVMSSFDSNNADYSTRIGTVNTDIIFDKTAPIPVSVDGNYGYANAENGSLLIDARFLEAGRFYGEYAVIKLGSEGHVTETSIINRAGKAIFTFNGDNTTTYYDTENNFWMVDGDIYNIKMQKITPENSVGRYIGNGYILVTERVNDSGDKSQEAATDSGSSTNAIGDERGYIMDIKNNVVYECHDFCSAFTIKMDGFIYAVVHIWGGPSHIVDLSNGKVLYTTQGEIYWDETNLTEVLGDDVEYLTIKNGRVEKLTSPEENTAVETISNSGEYILEACDGSKYTIKTLNGSSVTECDVEDYYELPTALYAAYRNEFSESPILVVRDDKLQLFDMAKSQVIRVYDGQDISLYDNSPFLHVLNQDDNKNYVCNLLSKDREKESSCTENTIENSKVDGFGNYFVIEAGAKDHMYNSSLKEISK